MSTEFVEPSAADAPAPPLPAGPPTDPPAGPAAAEPWASPASPAPVEPADPFALPQPPAPAEHYAEQPAEAPARRPRKPRPVLLLVSALVVGTLLGGGIGYAIQANRPPTPLPPLQVALPTYPAARLDARAAASAAPEPLSIDGDLRKLVLSRPDGTEPWADYPDVPSWMTVGDLADHKTSAKTVFKMLNQQGLRRAAEVDWKKGDTRYRISLIQFGPDRSESAVEWAMNSLDSGSAAFTGGVNGGYQVEDEQQVWGGTTDKYYYGYAVARRGTVVMEIEIFAPQKVDATELGDLAKRQWERLI